MEMWMSRSALSSDQHMLIMQYPSSPPSINIFPPTLPNLLFSPFSDLRLLKSQEHPKNLNSRSNHPITQDKPSMNWALWRRCNIEGGQKVCWPPISLHQAIPNRTPSRPDLGKVLSGRLMQDCVSAGKNTLVTRKCVASANTHSARSVKRYIHRLTIRRFPVFRGLWECGVMVGVGGGGRRDTPQRLTLGLDHVYR